MSAELGQAELDLGANLIPLDRDLAKAERRIELFVASAQRALDSLHADVDVHLNKIGLLADKLATSTGGTTVVQGGSTKTVADRNEVWGIRGPQHPGSLTNPIVTLLAAGKYFPMGSYAAAVGESNVTDAQRGDQSSGVASAADMAALTAAVHDLASNAAPASQLAQAGAAGLGEPNAADRVMVNLSDKDGRALRDMAATLARMESRGASSSTRTFVSSSQERTVIAPGTSTRTIPLIFDSGGGGGGGIPVAVGGAGGGGGDRRVDIFHHADPNGGGGGDSRSILSRLGWGTGILGMAGVGTAASFAGLGFEHVLMTALGLLGSAGSALGGGGILAAGALGQTAVGAGSNAIVMKSTIADTQTLYGDYTNLARAVGVYGKNSTQATVAQAQLNYDLTSFGNTAGVQAENRLAKMTQAVNAYWDATSGPARVQAVNVLSQGIALAYRYIPLVEQAATRNLAIINGALKPLSFFLGSTQGVQIFNDLENHFAHDLPTAMHAFDQSVELVLRVIDLASGQTGGFISYLDRLATRLNSMDNQQLTHEIDKLIGDFRLWEHFVKLLAEDIYLLFHNDVGTGSSIIASLTTLLQKLHDYETSSRGSAQIQNIFMVHKTEVLELLHVLAALGGAFSHIYLAVAPAAVTAMNDVVLPVFKGIADVIAFIARQSHLAAVGLGMMLISFKAFGVGATLNVIKSILGFGGAAAAGEAAGAGGLAAAASRIPTSAAPLMEAGAGGAVMEGAGFTATVAAGAAAALPILLAGGSLVLLADALGLFSSNSPTFHASPGRGTSLRNTGPPAPRPGTVDLGRGGALSGPPASPVAAFARGDTLDVKKVGDYAHYSATQLRELIAEMKKAGDLKINGISQPKDQVIKLAEAALKAKDAWNRAFDLMWGDVNIFYRNTSRTLPALVDDFDSNMKLIAHEMGINSNAGREAVATNVQRMVTAVGAGMLDGKISVTSGMQAIGRALSTGMHDNAVTWENQWRTMFTTVTTLYAHHKTNTSAFLSELRSINQTAVGHIKSDTEASYQKTFANLKSQYDDGLITKRQFDQQAHQAQLTANAQEKTDLKQYGSNMLAAMYASGSVTLAGATAVVKELNSVLGPLGATKIPLPTAAQIQVLTTGNNPRGTAVAAGPGFAASGGLMQIGQPGTAGRDTVPLSLMVGEGEQVAVFNRHQQPIMDTALSLLGYNGMPGFFNAVSTPNYMASGGVATPHIGGIGALAEMVRSGIGLVAKDANKYLDKQRPKGGGAYPSGLPAHGGGNAAANQALARSMLGAFGWGPDQMAPLIRLWNQESGWNQFAFNIPGDYNAAYGIPQSDPGTKMASAGADWKTNPATQIKWGLEYIKGTYESPSGAWAQEVGSGLKGYARGGLPGFSGGGQFKNHRRPPGADVRLPSPTRKASGTAPDIQAINKQLGFLDSTLGAASTNPQGAAYLNELLGYWPGAWQVQNPLASSIMGSPGAAIITTDPNTGQPITPYIDQADLNQAAVWLGQLSGWEGQVVSDVRGGVGTSQALRKAIQTAIDTRKRKVATLTAKVRANAQKIAALRKDNSRLQGLIAAEKRKKHPNFAAVKGWSKQIGANNSKISQLQAENQGLAGTYGFAGNVNVSTGGEIGRLNAEIGTSSGKGLSAALQMVANPSGAYSVDSLEGVSGLGGLLGPAETQLATFQSELSALSPAALQVALTKANVASTPTGAANANPLTGTVAFSYQGQNVLAGLASGGMVNVSALGKLPSLPPFAGVFHGGGVIPGPPGQERTAIVKTGETVSRAGAGASSALIAELNGCLRELVHETRANTSALSSSTRSADNVSYTRRSLSSDRVIDLGVGS